ncbi:MAG TPA: hypothetical protein PK988_11565, partial [Candidatus Sumerlaeota bacterium]|nr:hypothetical protein [Candidatus Sumerlaeota bacterium]
MCLDAKPHEALLSPAADKAPIDEKNLPSDFDALCHSSPRPIARQPLNLKMEQVVPSPSQHDSPSKECQTCRRSNSDYQMLNYYSMNASSIDHWKKYVIRIVTLAACLCGVAADVSAQIHEPESRSRIVAVVNRQVITAGDLDLYV